jgi:hypothetical protein
MSLVDVMDMIGTFGLAGAAIIGAFGAGYAHCYFTRRIESTIADKKLAEEVPPQPPRAVEENKSRTLKDAIDTPGAWSTVTGRVKRWSVASNGYSGTLVDSSGEAPFHFCECVIDSDVGRVIPEILADSLENQKPVVISVETTELNSSLRVQSLAYEMRGKKYSL